MKNKLISHSFSRRNSFSFKTIKTVKAATQWKWKTKYKLPNNLP